MKTGKVTRPVYGSGNGDLELTATLKKGETTRIIKFPASVREAGMTDTQCVAQDKLWLDILGKESVKNNITLPNVGPNGSTITWSSSAAPTISNVGEVKRPANGSANKDVVLTATITKGTISDTKPITCTVLAWTNTEEVEADAAAITWDLVRNLNIIKTEITTDLHLPTEGARGTTIAWASTSSSIATTGKVTRPTWTQGPIQFSLTATVTKNGTVKVAYILSLKATPLPITNMEAVTKANVLCEPSLFKGTNADFPVVSDNMILPKSINNPDCVTVSLKWAVIKADNTPDPTNPYVTITENGDTFACTVTRPQSTTTNPSVVLQVTASSSLAADDLVSAYKTFSITVLKV